MSAMFSVGEAVVCIDASDLPSPPWTKLKCGAEYVIRSVENIPEIDGNYDKNIHKEASYCIRLWGISNPFHPIFGKELAYAETRFEKIYPNVQTADIKERAVA
jgi:hypothetical protein